MIALADEVDNNDDDLLEGATNAWHHDDDDAPTTMTKTKTTMAMATRRDGDDILIPPRFGYRLMIVGRTVVSSSW